MSGDTTISTATFGSSVGWLPTRRQEGVRCRWYCFPHAGSGAGLFYRWAKEVPAGIEVVPVKLPGREDRLQEAPFSSLEPLVEAVSPIVAADCGETPFVLVGNSLGGLLAFEVARWLRRQCKRAPQLLVVASTRAPDVARRTPIGELPDDRFLGELQTRYGIGAEHGELMRMLLPTLRADVRVLESFAFRPESPLATPILALGSGEDHEVPLADVMGWQRQTVQFTHRLFPGGHFFFDQRAKGVVQAIVRQVGNLFNAQPQAPASGD